MEPENEAVTAEQVVLAEQATQQDVATQAPAEEQPTAPEPSRTNTFAVLALITALFWFGGIPAIVFGHIALKQIKQYRERGKGLAVTGLTLGYLSLVGWLVVIVVLITIVGGIIAWVAANQATLNEVFSYINMYIQAMTGGMDPSTMTGDGMNAGVNEYTDSNGALHQLQPDGTEVILNPDGTQFVIQPDGQAFQVGPNGEMTPLN